MSRVDSGKILLHGYSEEIPAGAVQSPLPSLKPVTGKPLALVLRDAPTFDYRF